ncbi:MAG: HD domain-containing protein [Microthrixaceae bacterium]|nr:HD domain-containing protein [Microthrixaceae bacterium]
MKLHLAHRSRRFFGSLLPVHVKAEDADWVAGLLSESELAAFYRMCVRDQVHSIGVARKVEANLGALDSSEPSDWILVAALMHDVGKSMVELGTYGRVMASLAGWAAGEEMAPAWAQKRGMTRKIGLYLQHPELGADILRMADSDPRVVAWAREHYYKPELCSLPDDVVRLLVAADNGTLKIPDAAQVD